MFAMTTLVVVVVLASKVKLQLQLHKTMLDLRWCACFVVDIQCSRSFKQLAIQNTSWCHGQQWYLTGMLRLALKTLKKFICVFKANTMKTHHFHCFQQKTQIARWSSAAEKDLWGKQFHYQISYLAGVTKTRFGLPGQASACQHPGKRLNKEWDAALTKLNKASLLED